MTKMILFPSNLTENLDRMNKMTLADSLRDKVKHFLV